MNRHERYLSQLPSDWPLKAINEVGQVVGGGTPSRDVATYWVGDIPWATPTDMTALKEKLITTTRETITDSGLNNSGARRLPPGSVLVTTRASLGMVAVASRPMTTNQGFKSIIPNRDVDSGFLFHLLGQLAHELNRRASGTTFQEISGYEFGAIRIPCPPPGEQARIAEVLDTLDDLIGQTERIIEKQQRLQEGLLLSLVAPQVLPSAWVNTTLGDAADWVSGGTPTKSYPAYWGGDVPWVSPKDMKVFLLGDTQDHLTPLGVQHSTRIVPRHSVLVVVRGMILAHTFPVCLTQGEMAINQDVKAVVAHPGVSGQFLAYWFRAHAERLLRLVTEATHGTKKIDLEDLKKFPIHLPSTEEQERLAVILSTTDNVIAREIANLTKFKALKSGLSSDLLTGRTRTTPC